MANDHQDDYCQDNSAAMDVVVCSPTEAQRTTDGQGA